MSIILKKLISRGLNKPDAEIIFDNHKTLVRGPSDTGKSYIRDCLWYLLGGDKLPKELPQGKGYDSLMLEISCPNNDVYTIKRSVFGGGAEIFPVGIQSIDGENTLPDEIGTLLVGLSGAKDKLILRSASKKMSMTGADLRHWSLLSQPAMISEDPPTGVFTDRPQRKSAFALFLTGQDDSSVVLNQPKDEKIKVKALLAAIETDITRVVLDIPKDKSKLEIEEALIKIDVTLDYLSEQQIERSSRLRAIHQSFVEAINELAIEEKRLTKSMLMASRFSLLDEKYNSDLQRLSAVSDGIAVFEMLENHPCLLCGTPIEEQIAKNIDASDAAEKQRTAMEAEAKKIKSLRVGLLEAIKRENEVISEIQEEINKLKREIGRLSEEEKSEINRGTLELSADPKSLAEKRTDYSAQIKVFDEMERLLAAKEKLSALIPAKKTKAIKRQTDVDALEIGKLAKQFLHAWGFTQINTVELNADECDLRIDGRDRLTYGAGKRAIFLASMTIALMHHAMKSDYPHLGVVVLDSPIKSYADPDNKQDATVSLAVVRDSFYDWLSNWTGPGQIIILENEPIQKDTASRLKPIEFTGLSNKGRTGFYPIN